MCITDVVPLFRCRIKFHGAPALADIAEDAPFTPRQYASTCLVKAPLQPGDALDWHNLTDGACFSRNRYATRRRKCRRILSFSRLDLVLAFLKRHLAIANWMYGIPTTTPFGRLYNDDFLVTPRPVPEEILDRENFAYINLRESCRVFNYCCEEQMPD
ncbi:hypothetical protein P171DRAFT_478502 [Karstenula rhodostoma CBS 690.94]|uniref:Uncharacterized protein n=1 Tax=Karstenula rhodostoma CBS 690.94 TaxID=1392251 RepID=A0A9P4PZ04_9PLEO|nr:hypothetical protein P171DRAFT_478502 [Karstenula rhodostoma CBS 690.94]